MPKSALPFGSEFSPGRKVVLTELLDLIDRHRGDRPGFLRAVYEKYWSRKRDGSHRPYGSGKGREEDGDGQSIAQNALLALQSYGIVAKPADRKDKTALDPTPFGEELIAARSDSAKALDLLASHILVRLHGLTLIQAAQDLERGGHPSTVPDIAKHLHRMHGLYVPPGGTHINSMAQWLREAKVLDDGWNTDPKRIQQLTGATEAQIEGLEELDRVQIAFARALAVLGGGDMPANAVADYAEEVFGIEFPVKSLPASVLAPLEAAGLITASKTTHGRGAKPHSVRATALLHSKFTEPLLEELAGKLGRTARRVIRQPLSEILKELDLPEDQKYRRGMALEALAVKIMFSLGLGFVAWRRRAKETSGAEVDVVVESARLIFSRWQIQCKHTAKVTEDDVAKEIGLAFRLKTNVVLVVTTGSFTAGARQYARDIMEDTNYQIVLLDGKALTTIREDPSAISKLLTEQAVQAMEIKRTNLPKDF